MSGLYAVIIRLTYFIVSPGSGKGPANLLFSNFCAAYFALDTAQASCKRDHRQVFSTANGTGQHWPETKHNANLIVTPPLSHRISSAEPSPDTIPRTAALDSATDSKLLLEHFAGVRAWLTAEEGVLETSTSIGDEAVKEQGRDKEIRDRRR